jgi:hypothetical protein
MFGFPRDQTLRLHYEPETIVSVLSDHADLLDRRIEKRVEKDPDGGIDR